MREQTILDLKIARLAYLIALEFDHFPMDKEDIERGIDLFYSDEDDEIEIEINSETFNEFHGDNPRDIVETINALITTL